MTEEFKKQIETQARQAVTELLAEAKLKKGDVFVVGCSSSEIVGGHIGKDSSLEAAQAVYAGIAPVLAAVKARASHMMRVEIEVDRLEQLAEVLDQGGADVVLLDNMDTPTLRKAVAMVSGRLVLEASGNMRLDRIAEVAATGVDYISVGALTHSVRTLDLGLDF